MNRRIPWGTVSTCWFFRSVSMRGLLVLMLIGARAMGADPPATKPASPEPAVSHPVVAGFDRFAAPPESSADLVTEGGRLLLGELNCIACHAVDGSLAKTISTKQAPVLDQVGTRVRVPYLRALLVNPQQAKPGTTMPDVFAGLPDAERNERVEALVHFLATTGAAADTGSEQKAIKAGEQHFHRMGCVACHAPRIDPPAVAPMQPVDEEDEEAKRKPVPPPTIVPLGDLPARYTLHSLSQFLRDPLAVRPSGRMPGFNLDEKQAREIASYFFREHQVPPNVNYALYEGGWDKVPDFAKLKPKATGQCSGFDLSVTERPNNFGVRFTAFLHVPKDDEYAFWLGSDDGSLLTVDGKLVVDNDGIHPHTEKDGKARLTRGVHPIQVDYQQGGGEWTLNVDWAGGGLTRQPVAGAVTPSAEPPKAVAEPGKDSAFTPNVELAAKGRQVFATAGCAACHSLRIDGQLVAAEKKSRPLAEVRADQGCLAQTQPSAAAGGRSPHYGLTPRQREAIAAALAAKGDEPQPAEVISRTMLALNCYACHTRGGIGGVEPARNAFFETTIKEMGDEGRLPPPLDGVGDKLKPDYLAHVLRDGAKDRLYMLARMPKFGANGDALAKALTTVDLKTAAQVPELAESLPRQKSLGRLLMGDKGLSCAKCHPFNQFAEPGIQALKLNLFAGRLREDWFYRYLLDPQTYRPGTRMPGFFPEGRSTNKEILEGQPAAQMRAMWAWLADGDRAGVPSGLVRDAIVLNPTTEPIIYRNFIEGLSPRGIAVGYPEQVHLAFDAERMSLGLIWQGPFIDASKHWVGRGPGFQGPLGDNVLALPLEVPFASLESETAAWPKQPAKELGYKFKGYRLDKDRRPTFLYSLNGTQISDFMQPVKDGAAGHFVRTLSIKPAEGAGVPSLYYRAAAAKTITAGNGGYQLDNGLRIEIKSGGMKPPIVRQSGDRQELLVPVDFPNGEAKIEQTYVW